MSKKTIDLLKVASGEDAKRLEPGSETSSDGSQVFPASFAANGNATSMLTTIRVDVSDES